MHAPLGNRQTEGDALAVGGSSTKRNDVVFTGVNVAMLQP